MAAKIDATGPLETWGEITLLLNKLGAKVSIRTVQRWAEHHGLPVRKRDSCTKENGRETGRVSADSQEVAKWWERFNKPFARFRECG